MQGRRGLWKTPHPETADHYVASFAAFRFHRPDCASIADIDLHNVMVFAAKDTAFYAGFAPCAYCRP
jgi:methylphosphotriester-DNA--protein-cysteine methyltransferase